MVGSLPGLAVRGTSAWAVGCQRGCALMESAAPAPIPHSLRSTDATKYKHKHRRARPVRRSHGHAFRRALALPAALPHARPSAGWCVNVRKAPPLS